MPRISKNSPGLAEPGTLCFASRLPCLTHSTCGISGNGGPLLGTVILFAGDRLETLGYRPQSVARRAERPKDGREAL